MTKTNLRLLTNEKTNLRILSKNKTSFKRPFLSCTPIDIFQWVWFRTTDNFLSVFFPSFLLYILTCMCIYVENCFNVINIYVESHYES